VASGEERRDGALHDLFVADDPQSDFARDADKTFLELIDVLGDGQYSHRRRMK
jgi:hypothetical protein